MDFQSLSKESQNLIKNNNNDNSRAEDNSKLKSGNVRLLNDSKESRSLLKKSDQSDSIVEEKENPCDKSISSHHSADSTTYLINCTSCFKTTNPQPQSTVNKPGKLKNPRIIISPISSSAENNNNNNNQSLITSGKTKTTSLTKVKKKRTHAQFLIKFHKFSLRTNPANRFSYCHPSKSVTSPNSKRLVESSGSVSSPMNQRCCLSVSVVPSDKHNAKSNKRRNVS